MSTPIKTRLIEFITRTEADRRDQRAGRVLKTIMIAGAGAAAGYGLGRMRSGLGQKVSAPASVSTPSPVVVAPAPTPSPIAPAGPSSAMSVTAPKVSIDTELKQAKSRIGQLRKVQRNLRKPSRLQMIKDAAAAHKNVDRGLAAVSKAAGSKGVPMKDTVAVWNAEAAMRRGAKPSVVGSAIKNANRVVARPMQPPKKKVRPVSAVPDDVAPVQPDKKKAASKKPMKTSKKKKQLAALVATIEFAERRDYKRGRLVRRMRNALLAGIGVAGGASLIAPSDSAYKWARVGMLGGGLIGASIDPRKRAELESTYRVVDFASGLVLEKTAPTAVALHEVKSTRTRLMELRRIIA